MGGRFDGAVWSRQQSINDATFTTITTATVEDDPYNAVSNAQFTVPYEWLSKSYEADDQVWVELNAHHEWAANSTNRREVDFVVNGSTVLAGDHMTGPAAFSNAAGFVSRVVTLQPGNTVDVRVYQNSGGGLQVDLLVWFRRAGVYVS